MLGKTKFTSGILEYFGLEKEISSPTFTIVNEYINNNISIYHFDLYRLEDIDEFYQIGGEEYFKKGICIIEWGKMLEDIIDRNYYKIIFEKTQNDDDRKITIQKVTKGMK